MMYAIFLRGINVNGIKIKMKDLREAFESMGYNKVKTIGATGNVIVEGDSLDQKAIENVLKENFHYEAFVIIKNEAQVEAIVKEARAHVVDESCQHYILLTNDDEIANELQNLYETLTHDPVEALYLEKSGIFWVIEKGKTLKSDFGSKVLGKKSFKSRLTSRNINTVYKVYEAMKGLKL